MKRHPGNVLCTLCPRRCTLPPDVTGFCRARINLDGHLLSKSYGKLTSIALDPIEKKPLAQFYPGSLILSVGTFGCNLRCPFCQNASISQAGEEAARMTLSPAELVQMALDYQERAGNIGVAFTYNEPLVGYEYVRDCAKLLKEKNLKTVLVTNGYISPGPWKALLPLIDAANIDLKGFTPEYYAWLGGDLEVVKENIRTAHLLGCHVEITTLLVPGKNDQEDVLEQEAAWLASLSPEIPLHLTRYFPRWQCNIPATYPEQVRKLAELARKSLHHVYTGNC